MQNNAKPICDMIRVKKTASAWRIPLGVFAWNGRGDMGKLNERYLVPTV